MYGDAQVRPQRQRQGELYYKGPAGKLGGRYLLDRDAVERSISSGRRVPPSVYAREYAEQHRRARAGYSAAQRARLGSGITPADADRAHDAAMKKGLDAAARSGKGNVAKYVPPRSLARETAVPTPVPALDPSRDNQ